MITEKMLSDCECHNFSIGQDIDDKFLTRTIEESNKMIEMEI